MELCLTSCAPARPAGGPARQLVVLCHGVGADGHDLIDLAAAWSHALPDALFIAPDAPEPYDGAPFGRQWFSLADRTPAVLDAGAAPGGARAAGDGGRRTGPARPAGGRGGADGVQPGRDDGAACRAAPPPAAARRSWPIPARCSIRPALDAEITGAPPVLLVHGEADEVVPFARGPAAERALRALGVPVQTLWRPGLGHGIDDVGLAGGGAVPAARLRRMTARDDNRARRLPRLPRCHKASRYGGAQHLCESSWYSAPALVPPARRSAFA